MTNTWEIEIEGLFNILKEAKEQKSICKKKRWSLLYKLVTFIKGWSLLNELVTFITSEEIERRLKNVTTLIGHKNIILNLHDYLFIVEQRK